MKDFDIALAKARKYGIDEAIPVYTSKIDVKEWVLAKCRFGSDEWGKNWSYEGWTAEKTRNLLREYSRAIIFIGKQQQGFREALIEIEGELIREGYRKSLALIFGPCDLCSECTKLENRPCCYPDKKRPSIEAMGIDIAGTLQKLRKDLTATTGIILVD